MAATTENQLITARNPSMLGTGKAAAENLYQGTLCYAVAASGYITGDDAAGANHFMGIVKEQVDNSGGSAGDLDVEFYQEGEFELKGSGFVLADVGDLVYGIDNDTIQKSATSATLVGHVSEYVSATRLMVKIRAGIID